MLVIIISIFLIKKLKYLLVKLLILLINKNVELSQQINI